MATRMQQRRGLASQWASVNPVLAAGEIGFETDTSKFKMGNGTSTWSQLVYFANATELQAAIDAVVGLPPATLDSLAEIADALGDDPNFLSALATNARVDNVVLGGAAQAQAAANAAAAALTAHNAATTDVHGIADTALLATTANVATAKTEALAATDSKISTAVAALTKSSVGLANVDNTLDLDKPVSNATLTAIDTAKTEAISASSTVSESNVSTHNSLTTNVHGIADTALLATKAYADGSETDAITAAGLAADAKILSHNNETTNVHGILDTAELVTSADLIIALSGAAEGYPSLAGEGLEWDSVNEQFDIDETLIATRVYAENTADTKIATAVAALTKSSVGLTSVDNTSDLSKPVSTVQATAIETAKTEAITAAGTAADTKISTHNTDTSDVHGIADTSLLALKSEVAAVTKASLGLGNVDNTADTAKPVSTAQSQAIATAKAEAIADATSQVNALLTGAPEALNTLDELAAALGDDANFAASVTTSLGLKVDSLTPITQKTESYTLSSLTERDDLIEMGSASAITLTVPPSSSVNFPIGTSIDVLQTGTGQVTIAAGAGVTVNATPGLKLRTQWSGVTLFKRAADTWVVYGDLTA
jgi:hypothetical protein